MKILLLLAAAGAFAADRYGDIAITPIRHATLMIQAGSTVIHVDPWSQAPDLGSYPKADIILITDIHGDHMDPKAVAAVRKPGTRIVAPSAVAATVEDAIVLKNGDTRQIGGIQVEAVPMYNVKRGPSEGRLYHDKGRGNGYVLTYNGKRIYIAGDTEGHSEMRALKNIDIAFIPMNLPYTMPPEEAAEAVKAFKPKVVYPYHYRQSDVGVFVRALEGTGIEVKQGAWY
jgi:L-ascorbate metabolism protein UlaG (beta-lactamase superfamily)